MKPFAPSCERNQDVILDVLKDTFSSVSSVLEIGSGTGQHAVHFARHLPHLTWQTGDLEDRHVGIELWLKDANLDNVLQPVVMDLDVEPWPVVGVDAVFSANVMHIVSWDQGKRLVAGAGKVLNQEGLLCLYGPFNYNGEFTSQSNAQFEVWLKNRDPKSGIRNFEDIVALAMENDLELMQDHAMPANNRMLTFRKVSAR